MIGRRHRMRNQSLVGRPGRVWIPLIAVLLLLGASVLYRHSLTAPDPYSTVRVIVDVPAGASTSAISELLEEKNLIRSARTFRWYARWHGYNGKLQAGSFVLQSSMSASEIAKALAGGAATEEVTITIPEGYTVKDIDALLAREGLTETGAILDCAKTCDFSSFEFLPPVARLASRGGKVEGYLYPDTYFVSRADFVPKFFLERLLTTFRKRVVEGMADDLEASGYSLHEVVSMASLVEEETRVSEERPVVAGILWKRLREGVGLGVDAAVRYIVEKPTSAITLDDLDVDSPYNLRKYRGLPPGPIANPGLESIRATLHPEESEYWYYLHGNDGKIHYARTNDEHNQNRDLYLR